MQLLRQTTGHHGIGSMRSNPGSMMRQAGATLMETMIALALSVVVTAAMVALMANSLGSATRIIEMTHLSDELRNTMSMLGRDVRRANYSANALYCYANSDCGVDGSATQSSDVFINADRNCLTFQLDRGGDGDATNDDAGGFRLRQVASTHSLSGASSNVPVVQMWVGGPAEDGGLPNCDADNDDWIAIVDPNVFQVTNFLISDDDSFSRTLTGEAGSTLTMRQREIHIVIDGQLRRNPGVTRRIEETIRVRNDFITETTGV